MADTKTMVVTLKLTIDGLSKNEAFMIRDLLEDKPDNTVLTDNLGLYDYDPQEHVESVEIK